MQEQTRVIRAYSEDTERPYYQIRYRLSLTGRELLADALNQSGGEGRAGRSESVSTTVSTVHDLGRNDRFLGGAMEEDDEHKETSGRIFRSKSLETPGDNANIAELNSFTSQMPGTPRSNFRKSQQKQLNGTAFDLTNIAEDPMDTSDDPLRGGQTEMRRSKSAGTASELQLNRGAPALPIDSLYNTNEHLKAIHEAYPQLASEFRGLVTCLNSKNVRKYKLGQAYRKGVIIGIDEEQGKIMVFQKNLPLGSLIVMRTESPLRYEKGYSVQDVQGRILGTVHAIDKVQGLLVVNTSSANASLCIQY